MNIKKLQGGSIVLGLVFGLGILGLGIAATTMIFSTNAITNHSTASAGVRSLVTADAATREGVYRVLDSVSGMNVSFTEANLPLLNMSNDTGVTVTGSWPVLTVHGTANNNRTTRKVVAEIDLFPSAFAFDQAVYTHGTLSVTGNVQINGNVYATQNITLGSAASKITGNAYSPNAVNPFNNSSISGTTNDKHPQIDPPSINITTYATEALSNGTYYSSSESTIAANTIKNNTVSGSYFIEDSVTITGNNTDFSGVLIVTGDLTLNGGRFQTDSSASNPLILYVGGNLSLSGNVEIHGIVYVAGETTLGSGSPTIHGSIISVNSLNKATGGGDITINYESAYAESWQNITGLDTESGTAPKVKNWHEQ